MAKKTIPTSEEPQEKRALLPGEALPAQTRTMAGEILRVKRTADDGSEEDDEDVIEISFASDATAVDRWWGQERLAVTKKAIQADRLNASAPFLSNHDTDKQIGVVVPGSLRFEKKDGVNRAFVQVRRGNTAFARDIWPDIVANPSIRPNVSFGYIIREMVLTKQSEDDSEYEVTDYEVLEVSSVSVPADFAVGQGRSAIPTNKFPLEVRGISTPALPEPIAVKTEPTMTPEQIEAARVAAEAGARTAERERATIIRTYATPDLLKMAGLDNSAVERWLANGTEPDAVRTEVLDAIVARKKANPIPTANDVVLTERENKLFSVGRALRALANSRLGLKMDDADASFEREVSDEISKKLGKQPEHGGMWIPTRKSVASPAGNDAAAEVRKMVQEQMRVLNIGTNSAGGYGVATDLRSGDFVELLRNLLTVRQAGATVLSDLTENVTFPKQTGAGTLVWTTENASAISLSDMTFGLVTMTPKTAMSATSYTRQLLNQSSLDVENLVRMDLAMNYALGVDLAAIAGTGSGGQPTGILNASGTNLIALGTNGASPTWGNIVDFETNLLSHNIPIVDPQWLITPGIGGYLKKTAKLGNTIAQAIMEGGKINDYKVNRTNQVPSNLTKGSGSSLHAMILGEFQHMWIGEWGAYELVVDPYSKKLQGLIEVAMFAMVDVGFRYPQAFSIATDAISA